MTEKVYEELDDAKAEIEKLKSENLVTANLCENLKRSNNEHIKRIQELNRKLERQAQEVEAKADEAYVANRLLEELKRTLGEKEKSIVSLSSANDKLRVDLVTKVRECQAEKQKVVSALEEANEKILNLEDENRAFVDKIEVLKEGIVSVSQKKCASESKIAKASKQMRERGDMLEKLEEEKVKVEEQLKWRNEQFKHLEEAHEKLRNNFCTKQKEWDMERCAFYDDISTLESKLDSEIRQSEDLKRRLLQSRNSSSITEKQNKIKELEESNNVKESQLKCCRFELESKESKLKEITTELERYMSLVLQLTMEKKESALKIDDEKLLLHKQIEGYESQLGQTKSELMNAYELLNRTKEELDESYSEVKEIEFELQRWKSEAEKLKVKLEANNCLRKELEAALLAQAVTEGNLKEDIKQKEETIKGLENKIKQLSNEIDNTLESIDEFEKQNFNQLVEEKDERISNLQKVMSCLEKDFDNSTASFSTQIAKMHAEMNLFHEAWEKMKTSMVVKEIEVQEKGLMIMELEKDLKTRVDFVKKCMSRVKKLSSENGKLMSIIEGASDWIDKVSRDDGQMMGALRSVMSGFEEGVKENMNKVRQSTKTKLDEENDSLEDRSPLRTINGI